MEILRKFKNIQPVNRNSALSFIHCLQIQILGVFILTQKIPIYNKILNLQQLFSSSLSRNFVICNFLFNIFILLYFAVQILSSQKLYPGLSEINKRLIKTIKIMPYVTCVQIIFLNVFTFQEMVFPDIIFEVINIVAFVGQLVIIKITNVSYRFLNINYLQRKNNSLICWFLIIPIVASSLFFSSSEIVLCMCLRSFAQLYFNFFTLENQVIRKYEYFYPFFTLALGLTFLLQKYLQFDINSNLILTTFALFLSIYGSMNLAQCMMLFSLRYQLEKNKHLFILQNQDISIESLSQKQVDQSEIQRFILLFRVLLNVYISRIVFTKTKEHPQLNLKQPTKNFDLWWMNFNLTLLKHKVQCCQIICLCKNLKQLSKETLRLKRSYSFKRYNNFLFILQKQQQYKKYFLIQFCSKPIKCYYQLIKLEVEKSCLEEQLQIEGLLMEAREAFASNFLKEKVQNQKLQIQPLIQFQQEIKRMRSQMAKLSLHYIHFYQNFGKKTVSIDELKSSSEVLSQHKINLNSKIDQSITKFDRNLQFLTFCLIYYKYFDNYTGKLTLIERKSEHYMERQNKYHLTRNKQIDVFDPYYGAIKIDVAFNPGKVLCITKNICGLLGFKQHDLIGKSANALMPTIFAKFHDKFMKTFIEKGKLNIVKKKERTLFVKAASKFIAPITVRLKVEYLIEHSFCSTALINASQTKSQFILMNNYGKIEDLSANIYNKLFRPAVHDQLIKIKRLCVYKMLLSLNYLLKDISESQRTVHQGIIMTSDKQKSLMSFFKSVVFNQFFDEAQTLHELSGKSSTHSSVFQEIRQGFDYSDDRDKIKSDLKESFRQFITLIRLQLVKAYRISFKFYEIVTSEFKCKMLQIISIHQELDEDAIEDKLTKQILRIGEYYEIKKQQTQRFKTLHSLADNDMSHCKSKTNASFRLLKRERPKDKNKVQNINEQGQSNSLQNLLTHRQLKTLHNVQSKAIELNDANSAATEKVDQQHVKENISAAFEKKDFIDNKTQIILGILVLSLALTFLTVSIFSMNMETDYKNLQEDNLIISNMRLIFEFRLAVQQFEHFYNAINLTTPSFLQIKKQKLIQDLKLILQNSIKWIDEKMIKQVYYQRIQLMNQEESFVEDRQILFIMNRIYSIFVMAQSQGQYLAHNYVEINARLNSMGLSQKQIVLNKSKDFQIKIHMTVVLYSILLCLLFVVFFLANRKAVQKQTRIIDFLPFLDPKLIHEQLRFHQKLHQHIKQSKTFSIDHIQKMHSANMISTNRILNNKSPPNGLNSLSPIPIQKPNSNNVSDSRLLEIIESKQNIFTIRNFILSTLIVCLCVSLVLYAQIFFSVAHEKFRTYIILKDAALLIENIPPRLMALHFTNFHHILTGRKPMDFPEQFYEFAHDSAYTLRQSLSIPEFYQTDMMELISKHITKEICKLTTCDSTSPLVEHQILGYMSYHFKNVFDYLRTIKQVLPRQTNSKQQILRWMSQNNVENLLETTQYVLEVMKTSEKQITELFNREIAQIGQILFGVSIILIPILIVVILLIRKRFIGFVAKKIQDIENIYKQLSWNILCCNSYAINYFQQKIKKSKNY